jgi:hypothetical protein
VIGVSLVGKAALATGTAEGVVIAAIAEAFGIYVDIEQFTEGLARCGAYKYTGSFTSRDFLDLVGILPGIGDPADVGSCLSYLTGVYIEVTP